MVAVQNLRIAVCFVTVLLSSKAISRPLHMGIMQKRQAETGVNASTILEQITIESNNIHIDVSQARNYNNMYKPYNIILLLFLLHCFIAE